LPLQQDGDMVEVRRDVFKDLFLGFWVVVVMIEIVSRKLCCGVKSDCSYQTKYFRRKRTGERAREQTARFNVRLAAPITRIHRSLIGVFDVQ
jgi:hypothetical protein